MRYRLRREAVIKLLSKKRKAQKRDARAKSGTTNVKIVIAGIPADHNDAWRAITDFMNNLEQAGCDAKTYIDVEGAPHGVAFQLRRKS